MTAAHLYELRLFTHIGEPLAGETYRQSSEISSSVLW